MKSLSSVRLVFLSMIVVLTFMGKPCLGQETLRIMPLGNSLTVGETGEPVLPPTDQLTGYRYGLKYLLQQGGYNVDLVGSQSAGSAFFNDYQHAGIGGSRDQYVERLLIDGYDERNGVQILNPPRYYLDEYYPDIILLHVGTNDVTHESDLITNQRVSAILDQVDQYEARSGKSVTVFLALIINRRLPCSAGSGCQTTKNWNAFLKGMAQTRINNGDKIVIVDMENDAGIEYTNVDFTATDPQGLHLNSNGYGKMAALWYAKITSYFNTPPVISMIPDQSINEGGTFSVINLDTYVNDIEDSDPELTWATTHLSTNNLSVSIDGNRQATITPVSPAWSGSESIIFTVTDRGVNGGFQQSDSDTVTFTISESNDPPVITGQSDLTVLEDGSLRLNLSDFTVYDPDPDQSPDDQVLNVAGGEHYTFSGTTIYPEKDFDEDLFVNVHVSDIIGSGVLYQALVSVTPVNDPPVYLSHSDISFNEDETYTVSFSHVEATDVDSDPSELQIIMRPGNDHSIEGTELIPDPNFFGNLYIETYVEDQAGGKSATFTLIAQINPINDFPEFVTEPEDTAFTEESYIYPFNADDGDDEEIVFTVIDMPVWMTYYPNSRLLAGIPSAEDKGYSHVKIRATDGSVIVDQEFYIHVLQGTSADNPLVIEDAPYLYPNPAKGAFKVHYKNQKENGVFKLYDYLGKLVTEQTLYEGTESNYTAGELNLSPGIYFYTIQSGEELYSGKLIIQSL